MPGIDVSDKIEYIKKIRRNLYDKKYRK